MEKNKNPWTKKSEPVKAEPGKEAANVSFDTGGEPQPNGSVRYKVLCDGGINPSGVFWDQTVPAGATQQDYQQAKDEMAAKLAELKALGG